jgi:predicted Zn-dependent protease
MLPFSRKHEYEADHMGLIFMAMAGYDPQASISFWTKMSQGKTSAPPEIMSTHPSDANRIAELQKYMPDALRYYKK